MSDQQPSRSVRPDRPSRRRAGAATRPALGPSLALALAGALTTWMAVLSWRPFTEESERFLQPLLLVGTVVALAGAVARWQRLPTALVLLAQVLLGGVVTSLLLTGNPLPIGAGLVETRAVLDAAVDSANQYAAPVPSEAPGVHPLLIAGGLGCFLLVDALAGTFRRVSLAGLPLLTIYSVPVSLLGGGLSWWVFALTAVGFLVMLYLHEDEQVNRWGHALDDPDAPDGTPGFTARTGTALRTSAVVVGGVATALALTLPALVPTLDVHLVDLGSGPGGNDDITLTNPMVDLRRDLVEEPDRPVLQLRTDDPDPSYLRISVLTEFRQEAWSAGDRQVPTDNLADGSLPPLPGVGVDLAGREFDYDVAVAESFESTWLPTMATSTVVSAEGDWRYDVETRDFLAGDDDLDTAGRAYSMRAVELAYDATDMARAPNLGNQVGSLYTDLPADLPAEVGALAAEVTGQAPSRYQKAVALQRWFRETGGFTYSLDRSDGTGADDLVSFLRDGGDGRRGYCEQFAAAMAVMARTLDIPARVAVGFLQPDQIGPDTWQYSSRDLHAWPELYFPGSGWVRFEPTPSTRASDVPAWTTQAIPAPNPTARPSEDVAAPGADARDRAAEESIAPEPEAAADGADDSGSGTGWLLPTLLVVLVLAGAAGLLLAPRTLRARRRQRRLSGGPEAAWAELRDTVVDLGLTWPEARSPRETRVHLVELFGAPVDDFAVPRPAHGPQEAPDAVHALDRIVTALEVLRYSARAAEATRSLRAEVETVVEALRGGTTPRARRAADWFPRSALARDAAGQQSTAGSVTGTRQGGVVDHVG